MNPTPTPKGKTVRAVLYPSLIELRNLTDNATQIEIRDGGDKPLGQFLIGRIGIEFRGPFQKKVGVRKSWNELIHWLSSETK